MFKISGITLAVAIALGASAQAPAQTQAPADSGNPTPADRVNVVSRTTRAVSYRHRRGATKINFRGTDLMPAAAAGAEDHRHRVGRVVERPFCWPERPP